MRATAPSHMERRECRVLFHHKTDPLIAAFAPVLDGDHENELTGLGGDAFNHGGRQAVNGGLTQGESIWQGTADERECVVPFDEVPFEAEVERISGLDG